MDAVIHRVGGPLKSTGTAYVPALSTSLFRWRCDAWTPNHANISLQNRSHYKSSFTTIRQKINVQQRNDNKVRNLSKAKKKQV